MTSNNLSYGFWLEWTLANLGAFLLSLWLIEVGERTELNIIEALLGGGMLGLFQAVVLSQRITQAWLWVLGNLISWCIITGLGIGAIGWVTPQTLDLGLRLLSGLGFGAACGAILGIMQWLVLQNQIFASWRWLLISPLCWAVGLSIGWTIGGMLRLLKGIFLSEIVGLGITWTVVAVMTGFALMRLLDEVDTR